MSKKHPLFADRKRALKREDSESLHDLHDARSFAIGQSRHFGLGLFVPEAPSANHL